MTREELIQNYTKEELADMVILCRTVNEEIIKKKNRNKIWEFKELLHFVLSEIKQSEEDINDEYNPIFDDVWVGNNNRIILTRRHIRFCERILRIMGIDENTMQKRGI